MNVIRLINRQWHNKNYSNAITIYTMCMCINKLTTGAVYAYKYK